MRHKAAAHEIQTRTDTPDGAEPPEPAAAATAGEMTDSGESPSAEAPPTTRRGRLQRSERLLSDHSGSSQTGSNAPAVATTAAGGGSYSSWEALVRDSFGHVAWPMKITSWELVADREEAVPRVR